MSLVAGAVLAAVLAGAIPPVAVSSGDDAVTCPEAAAVQRSIDRLDRDGGAPPWQLLMERARAPSLPRADPGLSLQVALLEPGGQTVMVRGLGVEGKSCEAAAEAVALMVERYFRDIVWTAGTTAPEVRIDRPSIYSASRDSASRDTPSTGRSDRPPRLLLSIGPAFWSRASSPLTAGAELRARLGGPVSAALASFIPLRGSEPVVAGMGQASLVGWPVLARFIGQVGAGRLGLTASAEGLLTFERAQTVGLVTPGAKSRTVMSVGLGAGTVVALSRRWRLLVEASGHRAVLGRSFFVVGRPGTILEPARWQGLLAARLGWTIAP
jgi:hypothetical protein